MPKYSVQQVSKRSRDFPDTIREIKRKDLPRLRSSPKFLSDRTFQTKIITYQTFPAEINPDQTFQTQVTSDQIFQTQRVSDQTFRPKAF